MRDNLGLEKGQSASLLITRFFYLVIEDGYKQVNFLKEQVVGI